MGTTTKARKCRAWPGKFHHVHSCTVCGVTFVCCSWTEQEDECDASHDCVPVCDVLSCEEIAQALYDVLPGWLPLSESDLGWLTDIVADLITRKVIVAGRRASSPDTSDDACCATRA